MTTDRDTRTQRGGLFASPCTLNIYNGSNSQDSFGGNKYSGILATDQSAGLFEMSADSPDDGEDGDIRGESKGVRLRKRKCDNSKASMSIQPSSESNPPREMDSSHLTPQSGNISRERSRYRTRSLSRSSSTVYEELLNLPTEPDQKIFRNDTGSWFEQGKLFEVSRNTPPVITNAGVSGYPLLVVMYRRDSSITCLPLRRHSSITRRNVDFLKSRVRLYARGKEPVDPLPDCPCNPLPIDVGTDPKSLDDMWINIERPHTIENVQDVEVALWGVLDDDSFNNLREAYLSSQLRNMTNPSEKPQGTLLWHLKFIFRLIWAGFLWAFQR